jgi:hypothetical protein
VLHNEGLLNVFRSPVIVLSVCLTACLSVSLSVCPSVRLSVSLSVYLSIYLSTALYPFVWPWPLRQYRNPFYTEGRTPWTGDEPVARPLPIHRRIQMQNKRTQTSVP